jgi:hypothetical protein
VFLIISFLPLSALPQEDSTKHDAKKRFNFRVFPVVAYDADMGFQYGVVVNMFDYGDWSTYQEYRHAAKVEISRFTISTSAGELFRPMKRKAEM